MSSQPIAVGAASSYGILGSVDAVDLQAMQHLVEFLLDSGVDEAELTCNTPFSLLKYCQDADVDAHDIEACIAMLKGGRNMLHYGSPLLLLGFVPSTGCFLAAFDGDSDASMLSMTVGQVVVTLIVAATGQSRLPHVSDDRSIVRFDGTSQEAFHSRNGVAAELYRRYLADPSAVTDAYDAKACRAFFRVAAEMLR